MTPEQSQPLPPVSLAGVLDGTHPKADAALCRDVMSALPLVARGPDSTRVTEEARDQAEVDHADKEWEREYQRVADRGGLTLTELFALNDAHWHAIRARRQQSFHSSMRLIDRHSEDAIASIAKRKP